MRNLEREIAKLARKAVTKIVGKKETAITVSADNLDDYLGVKKYRYGLAEEKDQIGVVTGLAYTSVGGDLLQIEALRLPGKGRMKTTGKLGDVMKESIDAASSYVRSIAPQIGVKPTKFDTMDIHVHVPDGATPKDGPSAGLAMVTSIVSALTQIPVRRDIAMTGEVSLRGNAMPIGGLKEKLLAALRGGIKTVLIPEENVKDLAELPDSVKNGLEIIPVEPCLGGAQAGPHRHAGAHRLGRGGGGGGGPRRAQRRHRGGCHRALIEHGVGSGPGYPGPAPCGRGRCLQDAEAALSGRTMSGPDRQPSHHAATSDRRELTLILRPRATPNRFRWAQVRPVEGPRLHGTAQSPRPASRASHVPCGMARDAIRETGSTTPRRIRASGEVVAPNSRRSSSCSSVSHPSFFSPDPCQGRERARPGVTIRIDAVLSHCMAGGSGRWTASWRPAMEGRQDDGPAQGSRDRGVPRPLRRRDHRQRIGGLCFRGSAGRRRRTSRMSKHAILGDVIGVLSGEDAGAARPPC